MWVQFPNSTHNTQTQRSIELTVVAGSHLNTAFFFTSFVVIVFGWIATPSNLTNQYIFFHWWTIHSEFSRNIWTVWWELWGKCVIYYPNSILKIYSSTIELTLVTKFQEKNILHRLLYSTIIMISSKGYMYKKDKVFLYYSCRSS